MHKQFSAYLMMGVSVAALNTQMAFGAEAAANTATVETSAADPDNLETIMVVAARENRTSRGATNLNLSLRETPQSVTVIGRDIIENFSLDEANDVLRLTPGVNVESVETDRTYYNSRGFDIKSMQVDGIGLPFVERGPDARFESDGGSGAVASQSEPHPATDQKADIALGVDRWAHTHVPPSGAPAAAGRQDQ